MIKKLMLSICVFLVCSTAHATTYYVRVSGGTSTQCLGTTNADYSGTGTGQACAFSHPAWAIGATGTSALMAGGDTLIIDDNSGTAKYMIGYGMPNTAGCNASSPMSCVLKNPPSGTATSPTKIYGSAYASGCSTKPQLWGTQSVWTILNLYSVSNVDIQCIEITDHSTCTFRQGASICSETYPTSATYGRNGIESTNATNLTWKNLNIHGMAKNGVNMGDLNGTNYFSHINIWGNGFNGWDGDDTPLGGTGNTNNGIMNIDYANIRYSGCQEAYPASASFAASDYTNCTDQNASGQGDGFGGGGTSGTINMTNTVIANNTQDGFDFLHGNGQGTFNVDKSLFEGNTGNQFKFTAKNVSMTNSIIVANCTYLKAASKIYNTSTYNDCRADGGPMSASTGAAGGTWRFEHNTVYTATGGGGSPVLEIVQGGLSNGTESYIYKNNVFVSNNSATNWYPFYNGASGATGTAFGSPTNQYNLFYNFTSNPAGTGNVFTSPSFVGSISQSSASNLSNVYIQSGSPAKGAATTGTYWNTSKDYNNFTLNSPPDMGALQYGSSLQLMQAGQTCVATTDCAAGTCVNNACSGSCTVRGNACSGNTCCGTDTCTASVCAIAATCGDGVIQASETCDGSSLGNQTCVTQGYTGGSLSCASDCHSFVTSSCTNTLVFPLTPILDTFTRSNSTGISNTSWTNLGGNVNISSNAGLPTVGSGGYNWYSWNAATFGPDEEVYATISNKGSNGDDLGIFLRANFQTGNDYKLEPDLVAGYLDIYKHVNGASTRIVHVAQSFSSGDSYGMSAIGSTIKTYYKASGGSWTLASTVTDTSVAPTTGNVGLAAYTGSGATPDIKFTNFGGGTVNPVTCGNGQKEGTEVCDGADLAGQTCLTRGYASGTLTCATDCNSFVTTSCVTASTCGNNTRETGEICDGTDINSQTCAGIGYASGTLTCASDCLSYTTTGCVSSNSGVAGGITLK